MSKKARKDAVVSHGTMATHREQALCVNALQSRTYDTLSDEEWVTLCELTAKGDAASTSQHKEHASS